jgi:serine/threonine protein kinase
MTNDSEKTRILTPEETSPSVIAPGAVLSGRYRLDSEIGRGGMGIVYRGTDLELMRDVAVKVVSEAASADARRRLIREARSAAALNHPHIVSVYDVGESHGLPFLVMELVHGPNLAAATTLDLPQIVEIA